MDLREFGNGILGTRLVVGLSWVGEVRVHGRSIWVGWDALLRLDG